MNKFLELFRESKKLLIALFISATMVIGVASFWGQNIATQVGIGALISIVSTTLSSLLAWTIIVKKNIAWMGPAIVIKYSILIASIYYVWVHHNVLLVMVGLIAQLIFSALIVALIKSREPRRIDKGNENAF